MTETNVRPSNIEPIEKHLKRRPLTEGRLDSVEDAIEKYRRGRFVIVVDDEDRENEGDLCLAGEFTTAENVAFMLRYTSGVICVPMTGARLDVLHIPMMVQNNQATFGTAFTVSVDAREGVTTGISAADRAQAVQVLANPDSKPYDLVMPGHIYPLRAREGGVLVRAGQTEASVDLCRLGGLQPVAAICELMNPDGTMMRLPQLKRFAARHDLKIISVPELIRYRTQRERLVERVAATVLPTKWGDFTLYAYRSSIDPDEHAALAFAADRLAHGLAIQLLADLGVHTIRLLTNNPAKRAGLEGYGLEVVERVPIMATPNPHNWLYLETKRDKLGRFIDMPG